MEVICPRFLGRIVVCSSCGSLLAYDDKDVYNSTIYCALCKQPTHVDYDKNYDGIVKEEENDITVK